MDQAYWLERERDAIVNARAATLAEVQLIHYGLAHRYSIEATKAVRGRPKAREGRRRSAKNRFPAVADTRPPDVSFAGQGCH